MSEQASTSGTAPQGGEANGGQPPAASPGGTSGGGSGTQDASAKSYSQADVDRVVSKAIATRERALRDEYEAKQREEREASERKKAEESNEYKTLYEKEAAARRALELNAKTVTTFQEAGIGELAGLFDLDLQSVNGRKKAADMLSKHIDELATKRVSERLKSEAPPESSATNKDIGEMSPEEWAKERKRLGIK